MNAEATSPSAKEPDQLLASINRSIFARALLVSLVGHLVFIALTSFGLYADWAEYGIRSDDKGFHTPSDIKAIKRERVKEKEEADRNAKLQARLEEQRKAAADSEASAPGTATNAAPASATAGPTPPPEASPLPPKQGFSLDDLPGLGL